MLNISNNQVSKHIDLTKFKSGQHIFNIEYHKVFKKLLLVFFIIIGIIMLLPWTQSITSTGTVTTVKPGQRPQTLQSQIPGRIEEWFVQEGDYVKEGDTILRISEVKSEYFDNQLTERTGNQITAKSSSVEAYKNKVDALRNQLVALKQERVLKLEQAKNKLIQARLKVQSDSIDLEAAKINADIANTQYIRTIALQEEGLKAVKDVEEKYSKLQETQAKLVSLQNKFLSTKNEVINSQLAISTINATYNDKFSKSESDLYTAQSVGFNAEVEVSKLESSLANYTKRSSLLYITAPLDGYINKALKAGVGETLKEGEQLVNIMPANYELAVEMYVRPIDLPLLHKGEKVRVQFDGWPAIVFSGWPNVSYGTYGAKIIVIENFISANGMYRVLASPDEDDVEWPEAIRVGSGAQSIALLENVPIWYELWRQINSFPPNFYQPAGATDASKDKKG
ncbi:HlyD family secretion protein [Formosa algae]|jgi:multidrug resistance efflux pump|uniref:Multidrug resistance efflux pump n=1 Tax=Formosa algae TaxID=225843 RepID=A0A9X0YP16_9FLAO|nr:biotin/lipoyl-binding protein [Formosa algae]MBP1840974.1 multidrug resistance efflux pump [Formosa algae]MDQ0336129.1 multidrug resistance efflux pump [Formosa algae]OEI79916.1 biotin attachment protein [Formosa algae]